GEHLLDVLALDGIAAYLRPSTDLHPVTRSSTLPGRPTDRLYVDRTHLATARDYLDRLAEEPDGSVATLDDEARGEARPARFLDGETRPAANGPNIDAEWAQIVAGFDAEVDLPGRTWPAAEDLPEGGRGPLFPARHERPGDRPPAERPAADRVAAESAPRDEPSLLDGLDTFGANLPDPEEDGYEPPTPPPVPRPSAPTALAVAGVIIGLIVFLKPTLLPVAESVAMLAGFAAVVGGFATLVWRLRPGDDDDTDPDDGARV
ncbi:MAG: hypothetical protein QOE61_646, partial [Micromonosporaceae bacterium]|nr:hypothetical protein [Micromonosporaceae bacterium]